MPQDLSDAEKNFCIPSKLLEASLEWNKGKFAKRNTWCWGPDLYVICVLQSQYLSSSKAT